MGRRSKRQIEKDNLIGDANDIDEEVIVETEEPRKGGAYDIESANVHAGVSVTWLAEHFKMDPSTVKKRLASCPPKGKRRNYLVYELRMAVQYLVIPKVDMNEVIASMKPSDLPVSLQKDYWAAMTARTRWEKDAAQLWHTDDVLQLLGDVFKHIKTSVTLWTENLERVHGITGQQRIALTDMGDGLLTEVYGRLSLMSKDPQTLSLKDEMKDKHDPAPRVVTAQEMDFDDDLV